MESKGLSIGISDDPCEVPELLDKVHTHANPQIHNDPVDPLLNPRRKRVQKCSKNDESSDFYVPIIKISQKTNSKKFRKNPNFNSRVIYDTFMTTR